jgi:branched-chain amino acid transport system ATP-binding protein
MSEGLAITALSVRYGGVKALTEVSFEVAPGQLVGLIGPNGAGKTTCIDALTGFTASSGQVLLGGHDLKGLRPHERCGLGLSRTWQAGEVFEDLTVRENLTVAASRAPIWRLMVDVLRGGSTPLRVVDETIAALGLEDVADLAASQLTEGSRKLAGVARSLVSQPTVVCLDEPAAGLDTNESAKLGGELRAIADKGIGMLLVEHDMGLVMSICDHLVVLNFGQVIAAGAPNEIQRDPAVIEAYLGSGGVKALEALSG